MKKNQFFIIPEYLDTFYIIPEDRGGKAISNIDKKSLHLSYKNSNNQNLLNINDLDYSIQLMTDENYKIVLSKMNELINMSESIFLPTDIFIATLNNNSDLEYFLLYKNFKTREEGVIYCDNYVYFLEKCLIVNVKKLQ